MTAKRCCSTRGSVRVRGRGAMRPRCSRSTSVRSCSTRAAPAARTCRTSGTGSPTSPTTRQRCSTGERRTSSASRWAGTWRSTLALEHPELVRSLVLAGTGAGGPNRVPRPAHVREAFEAAMSLPPEEQRRATLPYTFASGWAETNAKRVDDIVAAALEHPTPTQHDRGAHGRLLPLLRRRHRRRANRRARARHPRHR